MKQHSIIPGRLALLREQTGWSQLQLAEKISEVLGSERQLTASIVSMWETGRRKMPYKYMDVVTGLFNVTPYYLLGLTDDKTSHASSVLTGESNKIEIPFEHIYKYDNEPIFVEFINYMHENSWGIYDKTKNQIVFKNYIYKLSNVKNNSIRLYIIPPDYALVFSVERKKTLDMIKMLTYNKVYISMCSPDRSIHSLYDGWYHHNENRTALINNIGLVLPYDGLNISYHAYSMGDADPNYKEE